MGLRYGVECFSPECSILIAGCHSGSQSGVVLASLASVSQPKTTLLGPNHLAAEGSATITATCGKQSFEDGTRLDRKPDGIA